MAATQRPREDRPIHGGLGVNLPLIVAGFLAILGAAIHGVGGELFVVRKLSPGMLPSSRYGGPRTTKSMIHVTWHLATIALLTVGFALVVSGSILDGDAAWWISLVAAGEATGFAAVAVRLAAAYTRSPRSVFRHPGPIALTAIAALAWWGVL
jgi:hypothetical protein